MMPLSNPPKENLPRQGLPLILVLMVCILISLFGWLRILNTINAYQYLQEIGLTPSPIYLIISGAVIGKLFLLVIIFLLLRKRWSVSLLRWSGAAFLILTFIENMFLANSASRGSIGGSLLMPTLLGAVILFYIWPPGQKRNHNAP